MRATDTENHLQPPVPAGPSAALRFDWTEWLPYLDDQDIPEEQKRELIETLWGIVVSFVDLSWRLDPRPGPDDRMFGLTAVFAALDADGKEAV